MWQLLAKPLLGVVADGVKGFVATKKMKGELKLTEIKAAKKLKEDKNFYDECSKTSKLIYKNQYTVEKWKSKIK